MLDVLELQSPNFPSSTGRGAEDLAIGTVCQEELAQTIQRWGLFTEGISIAVSSYLTPSSQQSQTTLCKDRACLWISVLQ